MVGPMSLALYRSLECETLVGRPFRRPILDLGCGDGIFAGVLFDETLDTGIDPQAREIEKARATGVYDELIVCFGDAIPKPDGAFRTILSNSTWEHIPDLEPVVREAHRLLAPGGTVHLTLPTDRLERFSVPARLLRGLGLEGAARGYARVFNRFWRHHNSLSPDAWQALFERCGFTVAERREYAPAAIVAAFDLLLPFAVPAYILEKLAGRWLLSRALRRLYVALPAWIVGGIIRRFERPGPGAMVYFALTR